MALYQWDYVEKSFGKWWLGKELTCLASVRIGIRSLPQVTAWLRWPCSSAVCEPQVTTSHLWPHSSHYKHQAEKMNEPPVIRAVTLHPTPPVNTVISDAQWALQPKYVECSDQGLRPRANTTSTCPLYSVNMTTSRVWGGGEIRRKGEW